MNLKRVYRIYVEEKLIVRRRKRRRGFDGDTLAQLLTVLEKL